MIHATFNNISAISLSSVLLVEEIEIFGEQAVEVVQNVEDNKLERTVSAGKDYYEEFEDTKGSIRIRISKKNRQ
jgi:hypothetical protein